MRTIGRRSVLRAVVVAAFAIGAGPAAAVTMPMASVAANTQQPVQFRVSLPMRNVDDLHALLENLHDEQSPLYRKWLTPEQFKARFGADTAAMARVARALQARGFTIVGTHATGLTVRGDVGTAQALIGTSMRVTQTTTGRTRLMASTAPRLPAELANEGAHVAAFQQIPEHRAHSTRVALPANRNGTTGFYWFTDIKQAYDFPSYQAYSGKGRTIAIVMSNDFADSDMALYFGHEKLKVPNFVHVPVLGGAPFDPDLSFETSLDLQQSGGMAPNATVKLYNVPDLSDDSILEAYTEIVEGNAADIVSSSFGLFEAAYTAAYNSGQDFTFILDDYEAVFAQGNAQGITFVASSGDEGGLPRPPIEYFTTGPGRTFKWQPDVSSPASSPRVTAVGGTNLLTTAKTNSLESKYVGENAFGDALLPYDAYGTGNLLKGGYWGSGGGVSSYHKRPDYQRLVPTGSTMRTVPDVSMHMGGCPNGTITTTCPADRSAAYVVVAGGLYGVIGTSVSAPEFAGLLAVEEERLGGVRLGNVNRLLYAQAALQAAVPAFRFFHTGVQGFNGYDYTGGIYDRVLGVGTTITRNLILAPFVAPAGNPQTPSNP